MTLEEILNPSDPVSKSLFDPRAAYVSPQPIIEIDNIPVITKGNISVIVGPPKSQKSFFATLLAGTYLAGASGRIRCASAIESVLWVDTEQAPPHVARIFARVNAMRSKAGNLPCPDFRILMLREYSSLARRQITFDAIERFHPSLVIIDGIADLLPSNNDEELSTDLQDKLLSFSKDYNCHILSIIHSNPGSEKPRGHTGSNLSRKCESIMSLTHYADKTVVSFVTRDIEPRDLAFSIDDYGIPFVTDLDTSPSSTLAMFRSIIPPDGAIPYQPLADKVKSFRQARGLPCEDRKAKSFIASALKSDILLKTPSGYVIHPSKLPIFS